jgi:hypothetical protein
VQPHKEAKILERIISHQLIILDNPSGQIIEKLDLTINGGEEPQVSVAKSGDKTDQPTTPAIVRPSSLNYKISLLEAVQAFV